MPLDTSVPQHASEARWLNRFATLSDALQHEFGVALGTPWQGSPLPGLAWAAQNESLAAEMAWPVFDEAALTVLSGNALSEGMAPFASVYSGHQFGVWAGQLGDGRAMMLGEIDTPIGPQEVQLKGAGPTPYSRRGDGRAEIGRAHV